MEATPNLLEIGGESAESAALLPTTGAESLTHGRFHSRALWAAPTAAALGVLALGLTAIHWASTARSPGLRSGWHTMQAQESIYASPQDGYYAQQVSYSGETAVDPYGIAMTTTTPMDIYAASPQSSAIEPVYPVYGSNDQPTDSYGMATNEGLANYAPSDSQTQINDPYAAASGDDGQDSDPYAAASSDPYAAASGDNGQSSDPYLAASGDNGQSSDPYAAASGDDGQGSDPYLAASGDNGQSSYPYSASSDGYDQSQTGVSGSSDQNAYDQNAYGQAGSAGLYDGYGNSQTSGTDAYGQSSSPGGGSFGATPQYGGQAGASVGYGNSQMESGAYGNLVNGAYGNQVTNQMGNQMGSSRSRVLASTTTGVPTTTTFKPKVSSLYCFALMKQSGYENGLLKLLLNKGISIFACEGWSVYSDKVVELSPGPPVRIFSTTIGSIKCKYGGPFNLALNTDVFVKVWRKVFEEEKYLKYSWSVKVDPDCVFLPDRLRKLTADSDGLANVYLNNCDQGLHGPIEVLAQGGMETFRKGIDRCLNEKNIKEEKTKWGEDVFLRHCLGMLNVNRVDNFRLLSEKACMWENPPKRGCRSGKASFHPFKTADSYIKCYEEAKSHPSNNGTS